MISDMNNDVMAYMIKSHPELEPIIQTIIEDNKRTISTLVHELRNPLSLIKGTLQYIETKYPEATEYKYWSQLHELVNDMECMMTDASLLNTCNSLNKQDTDLYELINSVKSNFMPQASSRQVNLTLAMASEARSYYGSFYCDSQKMKQVFSNLIKNALEATQSGNFIHISLDAIPGEGQIPAKLVIKISNNGLPIPEDEIDTIFVPFVTYKKGGTGIGLAVVKKIIDLHYGSITVRSDEKLTDFTIMLPL